MRRKSPLLFTSIRPVSPSSPSPFPPPPILHKGFRTINYSNVKSPPSPLSSLPCPSLRNHDRNCWREIVSVLLRNRFFCPRNGGISAGSPFRPARIVRSKTMMKGKGVGRGERFRGSASRCTATIRNLCENSKNGFARFVGISRAIRIGRAELFRNFGPFESRVMTIIFLYRIYVCIYTQTVSTVPVLKRVENVGKSVHRPSCVLPR